MGTIRVESFLINKNHNDTVYQIPDLASELACKVSKLKPYIHTILQAPLFIKQILSNSGQISIFLSEGGDKWTAVFSPK